MPLAIATSYASRAQFEATCQALASSMISPIVQPRIAHGPLNATLQISFSQTNWSTSS